MVELTKLSLSFCPELIPAAVAVALNSSQAKAILTLIVLGEGGGGLKTPFSTFFLSAHVFTIIAIVSIQNFKKYFLTNKEVKTEK